MTEEEFTKEIKAYINKDFPVVFDHPDLSDDEWKGIVGCPSHYLCVTCNAGLMTVDEAFTCVKYVYGDIVYKIGFKPKCVVWRSVAIINQNKVEKDGKEYDTGIFIRPYAFGVRCELIFEKDEKDSD